MTGDRDPIRAAFDDRDFAPIADRLRDADAAIEPREELVARIEQAVGVESQQRRRRRLGALVAAAAAVGTALTAWWSAGGGAGAPPAPPAVVTIAETTPIKTRVRFAPDSPLFERQVESSRPNISIHFIYRSAAPDAPPPPDARRPSQGAPT